MYWIIRLILTLLVIITLIALPFEAF